MMRTKLFIIMTLGLALVDVAAGTVRTLLPQSYGGLWHVQWDRTGDRILFARCFCGSVDSYFPMLEYSWVSVGSASVELVACECSAYVQVAGLSPSGLIDSA